MILFGDCLEILPTMETNSVQCCITSPPYYGLRDYGTATWEGGDPGCDHSTISSRKGILTSTLVGSNPNGNHAKEGWKGGVCGKCGAIRIDSQIGLEPTPEAYVEKLVAVFRGVRRVLRDDGVVFLNLGDSYAASRSYQVTDNKHIDVGNSMKSSVPPGLKPKDLIGIPWRVAFALQADGWWLRQDIIWAKPNPMPESVTDRCTKSHEYIFLLTKSARYFYDAEAIKEPFCSHIGRNRRSVWTITTKPFKEAHFATFPPEIPEICIKAGSKAGDTILDPFSGAGTTGLVADKLGRKYIGIELNPTYAAMGEDRIFNDCPLFYEA